MSGQFGLVIRWAPIDIPNGKDRKDRLLGPTVSPYWSWYKEGLKDLSGANLHIKFEVNLIPLTPSSIVHKFNNFISKKKK